MKLLQKIGSGLMILGIAIGIAGSSYSLYRAYTALNESELKGLTPVTDEFTNAVLFVLAGIGVIALGACCKIAAHLKRPAGPK